MTKNERAHLGDLRPDLSRLDIEDMPDYLVQMILDAIHDCPACETKKRPAPSASEA